jgi:hypothetical protein
MAAEHIRLEETRSSRSPGRNGGPTSVNDMGNRIKIIELMRFKENTVSFRTDGQLKNIALHCTEAGQRHAFLVASVSGGKDAAATTGSVFINR